MPTTFYYEPTDPGDGTLILKDIRLARSPHEEELRAEWERIYKETLGDNAAFWAVYLKGETNIQDETQPELQSVKGFAVHLLRRDDDLHNFRFKNNQLTLNPATEAFYFKKRNFDTKEKVFADPLPIKDHATILANLTGADSPYSDPTGTNTDPNKAGHRNNSRFIRLSSL